MISIALAMAVVALVLFASVIHRLHNQLQVARNSEEKLKSKVETLRHTIGSMVSDLAPSKHD